MQKYLHLLQIVETEKTVAKQLRQQIEDGEIETERLKSEVWSPASKRAASARELGILLFWEPFRHPSCFTCRGLGQTPAIKWVPDADDANGEQILNRHLGRHLMGH